MLLLPGLQSKLQKKKNTHKDQGTFQVNFQVLNGFLPHRKDDFAKISFR